MSEWSKSMQTALALAIPTSVVIAYWMYSRWSSDEDCYGKQKVVTSHNTKIRVLVPSKAVGTIIGKHGATIKWIQSESGARLNFDDRPEDEDVGKPRVVTITGTAETAQKAEMLVLQKIADMPQIIKEEITVPSNCVGKIIGKGGVVIRDIRRASGVRIDIDKSGPRPDGTKPVLLTGTREQIDVAINLIDEVVMDVDRDKWHRSVQNGTSTPVADSYRRRETSVKDTALPVEEDDSWDVTDPDYDEFLTMSCSYKPKEDEYFQVMVSAVEHPDHFWVQKVGPSSLSLEQIQKEITDQLGMAGVKESLAVRNPLPGDMVVAKFEQTDPVYYRAKVIGRTANGQVDLYFVDYGDNAFADCFQIYSLSPEFHEFPHQAIECQLANVRPIQGDKWTDADITLFEDLVYCAQWKPLFAKCVTYTKIQGDKGQGDGPEVLRPCLQLVDTAAEVDVDIAEEMVRQGHALRPTAKHRS